ncbi:hypothetical protein [Vibrio agarivorans]|uniref:DUF1525 domain-containing protein n=1 Tax=Vibrio agarivorans TaxID=153622 RepID=A0ABT7Y7G8_9VIBR|nr:hypothetical protein [Vibrio agarivorans]MDN2483947.1 hypothetical protein [Vibrio agarivorans]
MNRGIWTFFTISCLASFVSHAEVSDVKVFVQLNKAEKILDVPRKDLPNTSYHVFLVDQKQDIMNALNSRFPTKEIEGMTLEQQDRYLKAFIKPFGEAKTVKMLSSHTGVSLMDVFDIDRVPAVLINNEYLTYGYSVSDSIRAYKEM